MNEEQRFIKYLKSVKPPERESPGHRRFLRWELLNEIERRQQQQMASKKKPLRIVYVLAALVCISALAIAGVTYRKFQLWGKVDGKYYFTTAPENTEVDEDGNVAVSGGSIAGLSATDLSADDAKRYAERLDELTLLIRQNKGELCRVIEVEVEGEIGRTYNYKYVLDDGSEVTTGQGGEYPSEKVHAALSGAVKLRLAGEGELLGTEEKEVKGKIFTFKKYKLTLDDGRDVILSIGTPKEE